MAGTLLITALLLPLTLSVNVQGQPQSSVPPGAQRVTMLTLELSASCSGDIAIHGFTATHSGMGDVRDILSVYAMSDGRRLSRGRALNSGDGTVALTFRPVLTVPACGERTITVMADFSPDADRAGEHRMTVRRSADIDAEDATVAFVSVTDAPIRRTAGPSQGSVTVEFLPLLTRVTYGDRRTVARLRLTAEGAYDQVMDAVALTNDGSARGTDLQNLTLETSRGQVLARLPSLSDRLAPFVLTAPLTLQRGQTVLLSVRADIRASRRRTIDFTLEEPSDLSSRRARTRR